MLLQVAIKIVSKDKAHQNFITKFLPREIENLKSVQHKNVVCQTLATCCC